MKFLKLCSFVFLLIFVISSCGNSGNKPENKTDSTKSVPVATNISKDSVNVAVLDSATGDVIDNKKVQK